MIMPTPDTEAPVRPLAARGLGPGLETSSKTIREAVGEMTRTHTRALLPSALHHVTRRARTNAIRKVTSR